MFYFFFGGNFLLALFWGHDPPGCSIVGGDKKIPPGFLAITRHHAVGEVPGSVEMVPISLPELPVPTRAGF